MSETSDNLTSSEVRHRLSTMAMTVRKLADRAAEAFTEQRLEECEGYLTACQEEVEAMFAFARAHKHMLRPPS